MNEVVEVTWDEIKAVASGVDSYGVPLSATTLAVDEILSETQVNTLENVFLKDAVINIFSSGKCVVITANFKKDNLAAYQRAMQICEDWICSLDKRENDNQHLSLTVVPYILLGQITILFDQLVYSDGYETENGAKLILCFDHEATMVLESVDVDYPAIVASIQEELRRREEAIDAEIEQAAEEERNLKGKNPYYNQMQELYNTVTIEREEDNYQGNLQGRISDSNIQMRFSEEEEDDNV